MAIGKRQGKAGGKRGKKKTVEAMSRKEWYDVVAPVAFKNRQCGKTICNKTVGEKLASSNLNGRVYEANLADLNGTSERDEPFRKVKLEVKEVQGRNLLTQFHGMHMTTDRIRSLFRKWCTTIETVVQAKTADGYELRVFVIAFTKKQKGQQSKNCYSKSRRNDLVRARTTKLIKKRLAASDITKAVSDLTHDVLSDVVQKLCNPLVPLRDVKICKVKVTKSPKSDLATLLKHHGEIPESKEGQTAEAVEEAAAAPAAASE